MSDPVPTTEAPQQPKQIQGEISIVALIGDIPEVPRNLIGRTIMALADLARAAAGVGPSAIAKMQGAPDVILDEDTQIALRALMDDVVSLASRNARIARQSMAVKFAESAKPVDTRSGPIILPRDDITRQSGGG